MISPCIPCDHAITLCSRRVETIQVVYVAVIVRPGPCMGRCTVAGILVIIIIGGRELHTVVVIKTVSGIPA